MNTRDVTGSMKPLDIAQEQPTSVTPYQLSSGDNNNNNDALGGGSSSTASRRRRSATTSPTRRGMLSYSLSSSSCWELVFCIVFGLFMYFVGYLWTTPNQRPIPYQYLQDSGSYILNLINNEEYVESTVPELQLGIVVLLCPILQLILSYFCTSRDRDDSNTDETIGFGSQHMGGRSDIHNTLCVYLMAIPLTELTTWTIKVYVGYLRPSFYALCQPDDNYEECTGDDEWQDGRMSFPSGHASYAFCSLTLLHLFLEQRFGTTQFHIQTQQQRFQQHVQAATTAGAGAGANNNNTQQPSTTAFSLLRYRIASLVFLIPIAMAIFIACSRVVDNKHFPADIVAGSLLGATIARYFHYQWFPIIPMLQL